MFSCAPVLAALLLTAAACREWTEAPRADAQTRVTERVIQQDLSDAEAEVRVPVGDHQWIERRTVTVDGAQTAGNELRVDGNSRIEIEALFRDAPPGLVFRAELQSGDERLGAWQAPVDEESRRSRLTFEIPAATMEHRDTQLVLFAGGTEQERLSLVRAQSEE